MSDTALAPIRRRLHDLHHSPEDAVLADLLADAPDAQVRAAAVARATRLVEAIRNDEHPGMMEVFLAEYGLSTREGVALMCLAEALLRVPDADTMDALIEDKIAPSAWSAHLGKSSSPLVNASTWALMLTGKVLQDGEGLASVLRGAVRRLGEPVIRTAVARAMREMGAQFVLGQTITEAVKRGQKKQAQGYTYSYDMLGEAAMTATDAAHFRAAYADSIAKLAPAARSDDIRNNPGISIKLSALHPRYEVAQRDRVMAELVPVVLELALAAKAARMGLNIDAEEADRLDLSLDVIEAVLGHPLLAGWDGFGVVVQAYGKRAAAVIDWLYALAGGLDRRIMVRLVKGAYWDTEIKRAQIDGLTGFPVFTRKVATDVSYLCCATKLLGMTDRIYPQFATHNAHTVAAILEIGTDPQAFEFQRLHGMGEALHDKVLAGNATRCRIYAPVGAHRDLLAYLVRRLLENGANSSFVNQIVDKGVPADKVAADPFDALAAAGPNRAVIAPADLYQPERTNSRGYDLRDADDLAHLEAARGPFRTAQWQAGPILGGPILYRSAEAAEVRPILDPATGAPVGHVTLSAPEDVEAALTAVQIWAVPASERAEVLIEAARMFEAAEGEILALLTREAGKTLRDGIAELREAVDFLRYYAARGRELTQPPRGTFACISPWNFPLAIFTGQIAAALAAGNAVVAKPAETTPLIACLAVQLLHRAGVPATALQLLPGDGPVVGAALSSDPRIDGMCFTGSTATAQAINRAMAAHLAPTAPLIAETGGLNAMIVDSTALPEQAIRDILISAFQSAGQRCSALRILYVQQDVAQPFLRMLHGAMDELRLGDPWLLETDCGPVITEQARHHIADHVAQAEIEGSVLKAVPAPKEGHFVGPAVLRVKGIGSLGQEIFGPVLHVATFAAEHLDRVVRDINASGYGLTFALHSRIDDRVERIASSLNVGNIYINRNQIGAVVGSQPFGGEGLSGTGPKAGGPEYVARFTTPLREVVVPVTGQSAAAGAVQAALDKAALGHARTGKARTPLDQRILPGPTGESNRLSTYGRGVVLCLGPTAEAAERQAATATAQGCQPVRVAPGARGDGAIDGVLVPEALATLTGLDAVVSWAPDATLSALRRVLAARDGALIPLFAEADLPHRLRLERHICIDTTAAGGNATLLAKSS